MAGESRTKQESVILSLETIRFVEGFAQMHLFGCTRKGELYRYFIQEGINRAIRDDVVSKHRATLKQFTRSK